MKVRLPLLIIRTLICTGASMFIARIGAALAHPDNKAAKDFYGMYARLNPVEDTGASA